MKINDYFFTTSRTEIIGLLNLYKLHQMITSNQVEVFLNYHNLHKNDRGLLDAFWTSSGENFLGTWWNSYDTEYRKQCSKFVSHFIVMHSIGLKLTPKRNILNRLIRLKAIEYWRESDLPLNPESYLKDSFERHSNAEKAFRNAVIQIDYYYYKSNKC